MRGGQWNDERLALLKALWAAGATAQSIANHLGGVSRSAVLGKIFRLRRGAAGKTSSSTRADRTPQIAPARRRGKKNAASQDVAASSRQRGKSLLELTNDSCRWFVQAGVKWAIDRFLSHVP
jgi:GcrA cell cycle regulator